jgi:hypothetical protein
MVVARSGIFIRDSTTINSKSLCSVKFGEMVQLMYEVKTEDTVDGMKGNWIKVKYNMCTGYVFDNYLGNFIKQDEKFPKNYPQYFKLNPSCGDEQYFNSDFYWYGVFDTGEKFSISLVTVEFSVKKENWTNKEEDSYLKVDITNAKKPIFIIGFPEAHPNYEIGKTEFMTSQSLLKDTCNAYQIYPGQRFNISNASANPADSYYLGSYGNVVDENKALSTSHPIPPYIKDYKIKIFQTKNGKIKAKDLLEDVEKPVIHENLPSIKFIGDLNYDSVPDILFSYLTGYSSSNTYLFMSGYSENEILTKVVLNRWGGCY